MNTSHEYTIADVPVAPHQQIVDLLRDDAGYVIHGDQYYDSSRRLYIRRALLQREQGMQLHETPYGFGKGLTIEAAIVRMLYSVTQAQQNPQAHVMEIPGVEDGAITPSTIEPAAPSERPVSQLDALFEDDYQFDIYQATPGQYVANCYGTGEHGGVMVEKDDPFDALACMASMYHFRTRSKASGPATHFSR